MKKISVSKLVGLLIFSSIAIVVVTITISMTLSNRLLTHAFFSIQKSTQDVEQLVSIKDQINQLQADTVAIIGQKDIDRLETQVSEYTAAKTQLLETVSNCKLCGTEIGTSFKEYDRSLDRLLNDKVLLGKNAEASEIFITEISEIYAKLNTSLNEIKQVVQSELSTAMSDAENQRQKMQIILIALCAIGTILILSIAIPTSKALNNRLKNAIASLVTRWEKLTSTAEDLSHTSDNLSQASTNSASSLQETSATVEEITSIVQQNADGASKAANLASLSLDKVKTGTSAVRKLIGSVSEMDQSSKEITEIVAVIDHISFQTNLLALNAAVEAARAGEHGKGFAVVADAVRALAQRSSEAAKEIGKLIQNANSRTSAGLNMAQESAVIFEEILTSITELNSINETIAVGSREQSNGLKQINIAINQLDQISQTSAQTAQTSLQSANELNCETENLRSAIGEIKQVAGIREAS